MRYVSVLLLSLALTACAGQALEKSLPSSAVPLSSPVSVDPAPISQPSDTPPAATETSPVSPGATAEVPCTETAPFAPGCLDQPWPGELAPEAEFVGALPGEGIVTAAAWSPDGDRLAYAVRESGVDAFQKIEVRRLPDFSLEARWSTPAGHELIWTPDGQAIAFTFDRGDTISIGLARLGQEKWQDLLPGEKAVLAVSLGKDFVDWLDRDTLAFTVHCGTGCAALYSLDIPTSALRPLVLPFPDAAPPGLPAAPYSNVFGTEYLFSQNNLSLAVNNWGSGLPRASVLRWAGPAEPFDLSEHFAGQYTEAQSWSGGALALVVYPPDLLDNQLTLPQPDLYAWEGEGETPLRYVARGAFRAAFAPGGDRLAVLLMGAPRVGEEQIASDGTAALYLALLDWPAGQLLVSYQIRPGGVTLSQLLNEYLLPAPVWSLDGNALAFWLADGGLALMGREGKVWPVVRGKDARLAGWGADGHLALLVDEQVWLVRVPVALMQVPDLTQMETETWSSASPDGKWVAEGMAAFPTEGGESYYTQLKVSSADEAVEWTVVDEWSRFGLGYTTPQPFRWSRDGRYLYFTNRPVPDGCGLFANGSDLHRVDLMDGQVTEIVPSVGLVLSLSPDEATLAYRGYGGRGLVIRDLATGAEREAKLEGQPEGSKAGNIVWSPDGTRLMLTVAIQPCMGGWAESTSIVRVDVATLAQTTLIQGDERLFTTEEWPTMEKVLLKDSDGNFWWMDVMTGEVKRAA